MRTAVLLLGCVSSLVDGELLQDAEVLQPEGLQTSTGRLRISFLSVYVCVCVLRNLLCFQVGKC